MDVRSFPAAAAGPRPTATPASAAQPTEPSPAHARLAEVFEHAPSFMAVLRGPQHVFELANDRYRQLVGHRELVGLSVREAFPDLAGQGFFELLDAVYATGEPFVGRDVRVLLQSRADQPPEERYLEFVYQPLRDADGSVSGVLAHGVDLTDRKRYEARLRERESEFRQLADAMPQIVFMARPDGHVDYFNRRWYEYTGLPEGEVGFESWRQVHTAEGLRRVMEVWPEALRTGQPYQIEYPLRRHDGQFRWHLGRALPVLDERGRVVRWFGTNTDIHDQRELLRRNEELLDAERAARAEAERVSRMKDEFLATLSHELRTPLNAILGWAQILRTTLPAEAEGDLGEGLEIIERNARAQTQIIEDLLDMGRIISGKVRLDVRPIELAGVVSAAIETVRPAADAKGVRIQAALTTPDQTVSGDPGRLQQVFWNLLSNAVKFTPGGGVVRVSVARVSGHVEVAVSDTGEGIRPEFLPHVFDRFRQADASTTRRHGGLGLGLAIVKQLTELHGGRVTVASEGPGRGTTFTVSLPLASTSAGGAARRQDAASATAPAARPPSYTDSLMPQLEGLRVLVVDDEPDARALLRRLLEECRATVRQARSAADAMEQFRAEVPDVLISDIGMPGEDGYSLIRRVRALPAEQGGHVPAIALTAYARAEDRVRAVLAGFQAHIPKPLEPAELIATVGSLAGLTR
jgi:PAS domain S-box-containing protein